MTHSELIMKTMGSSAPNMNHTTGIHFGVIPQNSVSLDVSQDIWTNGTDLSYESAIADVQGLIRSITASWFADMNDNVILLDLTTSPLKDYVNVDKVIDSDLVETIVQALIAGLSKDDIVTIIWEAIQDDCSESYSMGDTSTAMYRYESDGYTIETSDSDLFITDSPFYTLCGQCSPCAPNAGYLTSQHGNMKAYCLGADWFDSYSPLPYDVYSVATDELISRAHTTDTEADTDGSTEETV